jgi:hypothetical protein
MVLDDMLCVQRSTSAKMGNMEIGAWTRAVSSLAPW